MDPVLLAEQTRGVSTVFGLLSAFSGSQIGQTVIFALGIMPYISASIIFSVLAKVSPQLEAIQKEGASGQKKINQWTRLSVVPISFLQAVMIYFGVFRGSGLVQADAPAAMFLIVVLGLMGGALFVMWLGEQITEYGIGNGASLIIMANIISTIPASISSLLDQQEEAYNTILTLIGIWVAIVLVIVYIQKGERRIPDPVRATRARTPRLRRAAPLPAAEGQHGRRHADHLRLGAVHRPRRPLHDPRLADAPGRLLGHRRLRVRHLLSGDGLRLLLLPGTT